MIPTSAGLEAGEALIEQCAATVESFIPLCGSEFGETTKLRKRALLRDVAYAVRALRESLAAAEGGK